MKIATFNTNNVNKRLINLLGWLRRARPDVACLQELKATDSEFPFTAIKKAGYDAIWRGEKSWNGVAILGRGDEPVLTRTGLPGDPADTQSRYIEAAVNGVLIATLYAPNGNPQPGPKFKYKLAWIRRLLSQAAELYTLDAPVVLAGDFNVVPTDADIYPTKSYAKNALVQHADGKRQYRNKKATMAHRSASNVLNIDHATDVLCQNDAAPLAIHSAWLLLMVSLVLAHFCRFLRGLNALASRLLRSSIDQPHAAVRDLDREGRSLCRSVQFLREAPVPGRGFFFVRIPKPMNGRRH